MKNKETIAIYSRKSKFTGKGESIGNQVELCKEFIAMHYGEVALENVVVYEDEGFSGGNLNRPDFKKMMEEAKKRNIKAIVVYRLDRISRNISDFAGLIEELAHLNTDFISIREQFDTGTPMGRAMMYIASVFSQLERETIAERIRDNMRELAKTGRWLGGVTPTGYESEAVNKITIDGKEKKACKLKLVDKEAAVVNMIYEMYTEYDSQTITEAELLKQGIKTKNGKAYTRFAIKAILQNPVYMIADEEAYDYFNKMGAEVFADKSEFDGKRGIMVYNRTLQEKGKTTIFRPIEEWIVAVGEHQGIIPGKQWVTIQESLERNKSKVYRKPRSNEAMLTGLLYCKCGHRMYPKVTKRMTADGEVIYSYVCNMKERSQRSVCNNKNANGNTLDMAVIEHIKVLAEDKAYFQRFQPSSNFFENNRIETEEQLKELRKQKEELTRKIEGLVDSLVELTDVISRGYVSKRIEDLNQECVNIDAKMKELETLTSRYELNDMGDEIFQHLINNFNRSFDLMSLEEKRSAVRSIVRKVVWDGVNVHVVLFGAQDEDVDLTQIPILSSGISEDDDLSSELDNNGGNRMQLREHSK